ncbi:MAG: Peptidase family M50 [Methanobacterium sp. PtaB.Bin024]|nr:MAG: Peptidase family M50 [Methanobacterium sp. PtaB.Bin024]
MNVLWYYVILIVIIYILAVLFRDRLKVDVYGPILMRRTKKMRGWIDSIANLSPRFWRWSMNIGIPIAVMAMAFMVYTIIMSLQYMFKAPAAALLLPGVDIPGSPVFIPLVSGIIALILLMVVHEFGHGILARVDGVRIKSIGVILLAILPGAFVELEEEDVEKAKRSVKLRIYAAGSIFNMALAVIALVIVMVISSFFIPYAFEYEGIKITSVTSGGPAEGVLQEGMIVSSINGYPINSRDDYIDIMENKTKPGDKLTYVTDQGTYTITSTGQPSNKSITYPGTRSETYFAVKPEVSRVYGDILPWFLYNVADIGQWVYALNLMVGLFNLLPIKPLDGGIIFEELLGYKLPEKFVTKIVSSVSIVLVGIVAFIIIYSIVPGIIQMI